MLFLVAAVRIVTASSAPIPAAPPRPVLRVVCGSGRGAPDKRAPPPRKNAPETPGASDKTAPATEYVDVGLRYASGMITVVRLQRGRFTKPTALPRFRGRFQARVQQHGKVLEALRFDFPLLADAEAPDDSTEEARAEAERLRAGVTTSTTVRVPLPLGADAVSIVDLHPSGARVLVDLAAAARPTAPPDAGADAPRAR